MDEAYRELADVAYEVADEYRAGLLSHLDGDTWAATWRNLVGELMRRRPGLTEVECDRALDRGFVDSR
jgi:hypothetical protein